MSTTADAPAESGAPWGLIGQDAEVRTLARGVAAGTPAHAYLFVGPPGVGKGTLALRLAQALECESPLDLSPGSAPCGVCRGCRKVASGAHPDVRLVAPGGPCDLSEHDHSKDNSRDIKICQVRALERRLDLAPFEGRWRVEIIDPADALNAQSSDAFLKTLEEPPANVVLVLLTARDEALPETVRSRLRRVELRPAPIAEVAALLRARGAAESDATIVARLSGGRTGWALNAAFDPAILTERAALLDEAEQLFAAGLADRFARAAELAARWTKDRAGVMRVLEGWTGWWRDALLSSARAERGIVNTDRLDAIRAAAATLSADEAARAIQALREARGQLEENANPRLALDVLMLRLPEHHPPGR
jgi:DNA polymerase III subunit delta'